MCIVWLGFLITKEKPAAFGRKMWVGESNDFKFIFNSSIKENDGNFFIISIRALLTSRKHIQDGNLALSACLWNLVCR